MDSNHSLLHGGSHLSLGSGNLLENAVLLLLVRSLSQTGVGVRDLSFRVNHVNDVATALVGDLGIWLLLVLGVLTDLLVAVLVQIFNAIRLDIVLNELGELNFVTLRIFLLEHLHVLLNVRTQNALKVSTGIVLVVLTPLLRLLVSRELLDVVGNVKTAINSALQDAEDAGTRHGASQTQVKVNLERSLLQIFFFDVELLGISLFDTSDSVSLSHKIQAATSDQETGGVAGGVVGVTDRNPIFGKLVGLRLAVDTIALDGGVHNLADDLLVGHTSDQTVLRGVVLVLILLHHLAAGKIISLTLTTTPVLRLDALVVRLILLHLDETHLD